MRTYDTIGLGRPTVLLPRAGVDLAKWAVIACDQFTSEPEYWRDVEGFVGKAPSTLNLIYPEVYLGEPEPDVRIGRIREAMNRYRSDGLFQERDGFVYVERQVGRRMRRGFLACLDLERYDYNRGSTSLVRATEGTILERIPPRVRIREGAPLELPHIMVLIDDPDDGVIGPLEAGKPGHEKLYDFDLMMGSGRLTGYRVKDGRLDEGLTRSLSHLADPAVFAQRYGLAPGTPVLLYAMGDGNHSLATAKAIWEKTKAAAGGGGAVTTSPLRYALVEIVNLYDPALVFEPIHRVVFGIEPASGFTAALEARFGDAVRVRDAVSFEAMKKEVEGQSGLPQKIGLIGGDGTRIIEISRTDFVLPVGTLQAFLDGFLAEKRAKSVDYVHGSDSVLTLGRKQGNAGLFLPAMPKTELFKTVILNGALPRKTFSMGEAREKRFYMEARKLVE